MARPHLRSSPHVLMITNHGVHEWKVVPGLPDTGGQNVYVNHMAEALIDLGCRVTIANRGGYAHPRNGHRMEGESLHPAGHARIVYLEDGHGEFVPKEEMAPHIQALAGDLEQHLDGDPVDLIVSHYWDGGMLGLAAHDCSGAPHLWVPHSLGALKKSNVNPATWARLRIDERIGHEQQLVNTVDGVVSTSSTIRDTIARRHGREARYWFPPGVDADVFHPRDDHAATWDFLASLSPHPAAELRRRQVVTEISRTDTTKRKDVLLRAFAEVRRSLPDLLLVLALDDLAQPIAKELRGLIDHLGLEDDVITLGPVPEHLPGIYGVTDVYCTPSVMEGFGMSAQEAAATGVPVLASHLVPFAWEHLLGPGPELRGELRIGAGAIVAPADSVEAFTDGLRLLLTDADLRRRMGEAARNITVPHFSWHGQTRTLLEQMDLRA